MLKPFVQQNPVFAPIKRSDKRYILPYGGSGSGKSIFIAQYLIELCIRDPREKILLVRKVYGDIRESSFRAVVKVIKQIGLEDKVDILEQQMKVRFKNGARIIGVGLQDKDRLKSIEGPTKVHIEESNEVAEEDFTELDRRLRGSHKPTFQIFMTFNPNMPKGHWIRRKFFSTDGEYREDALLHKTTYRHNIFIDEQYKKTLERLPEKERRIYKYGDFYDFKDPDQLISEELVNKAFDRNSEELFGKRKLGVDAARFGDDKTALAFADGMVLSEIESFSGARTTQTASRVLKKVEEKDIETSSIVVDTVGLGAGVADSLTESNISPIEFKAGASPIEDSKYKDSFFNFKDRRSQAWWHLYKLLEEEKVSFDIRKETPKGRRVLEDLTTPKYRIKGNKKLEIEPKQSGTGTSQSGDTWGIKERIGRSTDEGDAVVQVFFENRLTSDTDYSRVI